MKASRVLIISASIGGGHVAAARALEFSAREASLDVMHVDLLDYTSAPFRQLYKQAYFDLVRTAPEFIEWFAKQLDRSPGELKSRQQRLRARLSRLVSIELPRMISRYKPDLIVHTHFFSPELLSTTLAPDLVRLTGRKTPIPQFVVITDFYAHSLWMQPKIECYFVASDEIAAHLIASGVDSERIVVSGIPIDPRFRQLETKVEARKTLGYSLERDLLLFIASGLDAKTLRYLLSELKTLRWPLNVALVCGRSKDLVSTAASELDEFDSDYVSVDLVEFTKVMPRYMAAADLLLGKPGGLTSSEALAAALPFAVVQPYPIQEEGNTGYLLEHGAAIRIAPLSTLSYKLRLFFSSEAKRTALQEAAKSLAHPHAAETVISHVLDVSF